MLQGSFQVDDIRVTTHHLNHPALTLAYRLEADGATIVYACDHEVYSHAAAGGKVRLDGPDLRHAEFAAGADLFIHDAQYTAAEYPDKVNWGHSTVEYAMLVAREAGVGQLALTHHDPLRTDDQLDELAEYARKTMKEAKSHIKVFAAAEGHTIEVKHTASPLTAPKQAPETARHTIDTTESVQTVLLGLYDPKIADAVRRSDFGRREHPRGRSFARGRSPRSGCAGAASRLRFSSTAPVTTRSAMCAKIAADRANERRRMPVLVVSDREYPGGEQAGVAEWLVKPFSSAYAQAKVQAWVHRGASRWQKASVPADEERRMATLRALRLLDTPPEPRFDRLTRLGEPILRRADGGDRVRRPRPAMVQVVASASTFKETSRDSAFAAHVVVNRTTLVVNDALLDDRFAENPLVIAEPRVRFYAGAPLILLDGTCIGTLSLLDTRPRWFAASDIQLLEDLRDLAVSEIERERITTQTGTQSAGD